jgi:hypothetical protein
MEHNSVGLPNYDPYGQWLDVRNADFIVNFQTGAPPQGYSYSIIIIATPGDEDFVNLSVSTPSDAGWSAMVIQDEFHEIEEDKFCPLIFKSLSALGIEGYISLGLKLHVDQWGHCTLYYWVNPSDGVLPSDDEH